jgi:proteasome accessory factor C
MDKWEKTVRLHRLLCHNKYGTPLNTILKELDCHEATFHRIRNFLKNILRAPIVFDHGSGGYRYQTSDGQPFELPGFWLTQNEIEALLCLDHAVENMQEGFFHDLLEPVRKRFEPLLKAQKTNINTLRERMKIISIGTRECDKDIFKAIASAVVREKRIVIKHRNLAADKPQERIISPQALVRYRDNWYVDAYCHLRNEPRTFSLNRIVCAEPVIGKFFKIPKEVRQVFYAESYGIFTGPANKKAVIEFTGIAAREVAQENWHPKQQGQWQNENTYRLMIPYGHSRELEMDILRWGDEAEVIEPKELRESIKTTVAKMQKKYEK